MRSRHKPAAGSNLLCWSLVSMLAILQLAIWLGGGVTEDSSPVDECLQLLALPVLVMAVVMLSNDPPREGLVRAGLLTMLLIVLVPAIQLLPLPAASWSGTAARSSLAIDLGQAGAGRASSLLSLAPLASEQGLWFLMPGVAAFLSALALPASFRRWMVSAVVLLVVLNIPFAFFQAGLPRDSDMRLYQYPDGSEAFGGLFINHNHHATALVVGMVLSIALAIDGWRRRAGASPFGLYLVYVVTAAFCIVAIPFTGSRAGGMLVLPMLLLVLLLAGALPLARIGRSRPGRILMAAMAVLGLLGAWFVLGWLATASADDPRFAVADATFRRGMAYAPWGSGIGSFVQTFAQNAPDLLMMPAYANHAHNEYAEWWLTGGVPAMLALIVGLAVFAATGIRIFRLQGRSGSAVLAAGCWTALAVALIHSWVDFPLRTTALMSMESMLAGLMFACTADGMNRRRRRSRPDAEESR